MVTEKRELKINIEMVFSQKVTVIRKHTFKISYVTSSMYVDSRDRWVRN